MITAYESLCALIEEEIGRQERVLAATRAQGAAARNRDMKTLDVQTAALLGLAREATQADADRKRLVRGILGADVREGVTLGEIIARAPEPFASRLRELQTRLKAALNAAREETRANAVLMRLALKVVGGALSAVEPNRLAWAAGYAANGHNPATPAALQPAIMDRKG